MDYNSLHTYLEARFKNEPSVTDAMVQQAKKDYWRMYNTALKRRIRNEYPILRLRFSKQEIELLKEKLHQKELLSIQVHRIVMDYISGTNTSENIALVEQQLFLVSEYLEKLLEQGNALPLSKIEKLQESIVAIQEALEQNS